MKIDPDNFYLVIKPHRKTTDFEEVFIEEQRNLTDLKNLFEIYKTEDIHGIYNDPIEARTEADLLWRKHGMTSDNTAINPNNAERRFSGFIKELTKISNKYQIAIQSTGGVSIFNDKEKIKYDEDHTSGDLNAYW